MPVYFGKGWENMAVAEKTCFRIHPDDTVAVALRDLQPGENVQVGGREIVVREEIGTGHKLALSDMAPGHSVIKYGNVIGSAATNIRSGEKVHTHNMKTNLKGLLDYTYRPRMPGTKSRDRRTSGNVHGLSEEKRGGGDPQ